MKIIVLGANGRTGSQLMRLALERAAYVTTIVRSEDKCLDLEDDNLTTVFGDPCDPKFLSRAFRGKDVVVSTLGGRTPTKGSSRDKRFIPRLRTAVMFFDAVEAVRHTLNASEWSLAAFALVLHRISSNSRLFGKLAARIR